MRNKLIQEAAIRVAVALSDLTIDEALYVLYTCEQTKQMQKHGEQELHRPLSKKFHRLFNAVKNHV